MDRSEKHENTVREISELLRMKPVETKRLQLRPFQHSNLDERYDCLSQNEGKDTISRGFMRAFSRKRHIFPLTNKALPCII